MKKQKTTKPAAKLVAVKPKPEAEPKLPPLRCLSRNSDTNRYARWVEVEGGIEAICNDDVARTFADLDALSAWLNGH